MAVNGVRLFRYALMGEVGFNFLGIIPMIFTPEVPLSYFITDASQITPATRSITQWTGAIVLGLTVPLALSIPHTPRAPAARRTLYTLFAACEAGLGTVMAMQWLQGDSGLKQEALASSMLTMGLLVGLRSFFLFVRPSYMEGQANASKAK